MVEKPDVRVREHLSERQFSSVRRRNRILNVEARTIKCLSFSVWRNPE